MTSRKTCVARSLAHLVLSCGALVRNAVNGVPLGKMRRLLAFGFSEHAPRVCPLKRTLTLLLDLALMTF